MRRGSETYGEEDGPDRAHRASFPHQGTRHVSEAVLESPDQPPGEHPQVTAQCSVEQKHLPAEPSPNS